MVESIGVIGAGAWGTVLASVLSEGGHKVRLWALEKEVAQTITQRHENALFLPDCPISPKLICSNAFEEVVSGASHLINAVPSHAIRRVWSRASSLVVPDTIVANFSKGFEPSTTKRPSQVLLESLPQISSQQVVTVSGPSFAKEVYEHRLTTLVVAGTYAPTMKRWQKIIRQKWLLVYTNEDLIGVEVGGAIKNVIAIATGIVDGLKLGYNTRAALITRGLYEMAKIGKALGANPFTFAGLSGMGDLILTCTGELSRNRSVGLNLGEGKSIKEILGQRKQVAEGVGTAKEIHEISKRHRVSVPICQEIYRILYEGKPVTKALEDLMKMELREELGGLLK